MDDAIIVTSTTSVRLILLSPTIVGNATTPLTEVVGYAKGHAPIILLDDVRPDAERLARCGASDWLSSTISFHDTIDQIDRWCGIAPA